MSKKTRDEAGKAWSSAARALQYAKDALGVLNARRDRVEADEYNAARYAVETADDALEAAWVEFVKQRRLR